MLTVAPSSSQLVDNLGEFTLLDHQKDRSVATGPVGARSRSAVIAMRIAMRPVAIAKRVQ